MKTLKSKFYGKYKNIRNAAWQFLIDFQIKSLPINLLEICDQMEIAVLSYDTAKDFIDALKLNEQANANEGFTIFFDENWYILFKDWHFSSANINRTIAHELGHILLGHKFKICDSNQSFAYTKKNVQSICNDGLEREADMFALRILSPACVLKELNVQSYTEIMELCYLPKLYALQRMKRLEELYRRNSFYKDKMERQVIRQFAEFISSEKTHRI
jgi:Zn-dependent peptidase ImmA (M78 family)